MIDKIVFMLNSIIFVNDNLFCHYLNLKSHYALLLDFELSGNNVSPLICSFVIEFSLISTLVTSADMIPPFKFN